MNNSFNDFISDEDKSLKGGTPGVKFGLNAGVKLVKVEYNPKAGKDGADSDALDVEIEVNEKITKIRKYAITRVFGKEGEITDTKSEAYKKAYATEFAQLKGWCTHILKVFFTEEEIKTNLSRVNIQGFGDYFKFIADAVKAGIQKQGNLVDVFLQYQWVISPGQNVTFLEIPKNLKDGAFICKAIPAKGEGWVEIRDKDGLKYQDGEGNIHRFERTADYLTTNKAIQQKSGEDNGAGGNIEGTTASDSSTNW